MNWVAQLEAKQHVLALREILVRFDENLAAHTLMQHCVPYILEEDPDVARARSEQQLKVAHLLGGAEEYSGYYASNQHERPFEQQYAIEPAEAHEHLHRVAFLREWLAEQQGPVRILDLACNDGWLAQNLNTEFKDRPFPEVIYHGLDLNPGCIERAIGREVEGARFAVAAAEDAERETWPLREPDGYDAVIAYELIEHVRDPDAVLSAMVSVARPDGSLFVSTPLGACAGGDLQHWWVLEPAGHVRAFTPRSFAELLNRHGQCDGILVHNAAQGELMVARTTARDPSKPRYVLAPEGFGAWDTLPATDELGARDAG